MMKNNLADKLLTTIAYLTCESTSIWCLHEPKVPQAMLDARKLEKAKEEK